jgi:GNAT superfamily N-acetyltransferase
LRDEGEVVMNIRRAVPSDAEALARVHIGAWVTTYKGLIPDEELARRTRQSTERAQRWRDDLSAADSPNVVFVAEDKEDVVGFASAGPERDGAPVYKGEVRAIYILEEWQRKGIGRQLMAAAGDELQRRGITSMLIWVIKDNPNCAFYERLGGAPVKEKEIEFGEKKVMAVAYGWRDVGLLLAAARKGSK